MPLYNGFSTINRHEKLMNPDFGTIIWDVLFDQLTDELKLAIEVDLTEIIRYDPRVTAESLFITEYENGIQILMELRLVETNQIQKMRLQFDRNNRTTTFT